MFRRSGLVGSTGLIRQSLRFFLRCSVTCHVLGGTNLNLDRSKSRVVQSHVMAAKNLYGLIHQGWGGASDACTKVLPGRRCFPPDALRELGGCGMKPEVIGISVSMDPRTACVPASVGAVASLRNNRGCIRCIGIGARGGKLGRRVHPLARRRNGDSLCLSAGLHWRSESTPGCAISACLR
jgi:hypothetical protein